MNEIRAFLPGVTTAYAVVRAANGDVWEPSGQAFEAWGTGGRTAADYDLALTDKSGGMFVGDFDTNIGAGSYIAVVHQQAGGAPADTDPVVWIQQGAWDGAAWSDAGNVTGTLAAIAAILGTPVALDGGSATLAGMLTKLADDNGGADFDATTDSLERVRDKLNSVYARINATEGTVPTQTLDGAAQ